MSNNEELKAQAWPWVAKLAGSILILSVALKVIGIDFSPVMQALTVSIAQNIEHKGYKDLEKRIEELEKNSHPSKEKKGELGGE